MTHDSTGLPDLPGRYRSEGCAPGSERERQGQVDAGWRTTMLRLRFCGVYLSVPMLRRWARGQRCIIPATTFDEPNWETGKNVWWRFARADGDPWGLAGLWNVWTDPASGQVQESYTMLTINADAHPLMSRMHKPDPKLPADKQDKRSVIPIELGDVDQWLAGTVAEASQLLRVAPVAVFQAGPVD